MNCHDIPFEVIHGVIVERLGAPDTRPVHPKAWGHSKCSPNMHHVFLLASLVVSLALNRGPYTIEQSEGW
jgi:hypothetical protein